MDPYIDKYLIYQTVHFHVYRSLSYHCKTITSLNICIFFPAGEKTVTMPTDKSRHLTILHFNDVYNIEARDKEPVGGAARFTTLIKSKAHLNPLVLFSGDAFNPSISKTLNFIEFKYIPMYLFKNISMYLFKKSRKIKQFWNIEKCIYKYMHYLNISLSIHDKAILKLNDLV